MKFLPRILLVLEIVGVLLTLGGLALKYLNSPGGDEGLLIGASLLSCVYFLKGFMPPPQPAGDNAQPTPGNVFASTVVPKVGWIACSVCIVGLMYGWLHLHGAREMLMVGSSTLAVVIALSLFFIATGSPVTPRLMKLLYRAAPICVFGINVFVNLPPR